MSGELKPNYGGSLMLRGEEVIVIMEPENQQTEPVAATSSEKERPWYVFWD